MEEFSLGRPKGGSGRLIEGLSSHPFLQLFQQLFSVAWTLHRNF